MTKQSSFSLFGLIMRPMSGLLGLAVRLGLTMPMMRLMGKRMNSPAGKRRAFADYTPTGHDVFVATFSKSGTNWMMQIAYQIAHYGQGEFEHIHDEIPWPEAPMPGIVSLTDTGPQKRSPTGLRVIKTHAEAEYVPYNEEARYIVVVRDPRDVFVSGYYFAGTILPGGITYSVDEFLQSYLSGHFLFGSWAAHLAGYWAWRERKNVLVIFYDELKRDPSGSVQRVADLLGVTLTEEQVAAVVEKSSFAYMQAIDHKFMPPIPFRQGGKKPVLMRSGKSGEAVELLSPEQEQAIHAFAQAELARLGSDFPYAHYFGG